MSALEELMKRATTRTIDLDISEQAAAELTALQASRDGWESVAKKAYSRLMARSKECDALQADLDSARTAMEAVTAIHPYFVEVPAHNKCVYWLIQHPRPEGQKDES